jgi:hypothetical protein
MYSNNVAKKEKSPSQKVGTKRKTLSERFNLKFRF